MGFEDKLKSILEKVAESTEVNDHTGARILLCNELLEQFTIEQSSELHMIRGHYRIIQREQTRVGELKPYYCAMRSDTDRSLYKLLDIQFTKPIRKNIQRYL